MATHPGDRPEALASDPKARGSLGPVANHDPAGVQDQPDYAGEAALLRQQVRPRLPDPLPTDAREACRRMLDAAEAFYSEVEGDEKARQQTARWLRASREADLRACAADTSPAAAACVTVLLGDRDTEFAWLLDQCSRAFPRGEVGARP